MSAREIAVSFMSNWSAFQIMALVLIACFAFSTLDAGLFWGVVEPAVQRLILGLTVAFTFRDWWKARRGKPGSDAKMEE